MIFSRRSRPWSGGEPAAAALIASPRFPGIFLRISCRVIDMAHRLLNFTLALQRLEAGVMPGCLGPGAGDCHPV